MKVFLFGKPTQHSSKPYSARKTSGNARIWARLHWQIRWTAVYSWSRKSMSCWRQWLAQCGDGWAEQAGRSFSAAFLSTWQLHLPKTKLRRALSPTQPFMTMGSSKQNNRRHTRAMWPLGTSLSIKEKWHVEERGCEHVTKSLSNK